MTTPSPLLPETKTRIERYVSILKEVETAPLQDYFNKYEDKPNDLREHDLMVFEGIASAYQKFTTAHSELTKDQKFDVYKSFLVQTMGLDAHGISKNLSNEDTAEIQKLFCENILPVIQKLK